MIINNNLLSTCLFYPGWFVRFSGCGRKLRKIPIYNKMQGRQIFIVQSGKIQEGLEFTKRMNFCQVRAGWTPAGGKSWNSKRRWESSKILMSVTTISSAHFCHQDFLDTHMYFLPHENLESFPLTFLLLVLTWLWLRSLPRTGIGSLCEGLFSVLSSFPGH